MCAGHVHYGSSFSVSCRVYGASSSALFDAYTDARVVCWVLRLLMPLVRYLVYLYTDSVYDALRIVPTGHNERPPSTETSAMSPFFYAWRPATHFKRTQPPPPEFRICVLETEKQPMLQGRDFEVLFSHVPLPTADSNDDQDAKALEAIREQNRRAYGKQRPARPRPVSKHPTTRLGPMLARLRRCLDLLSAWLRALCLWAGMPLRTPERLPSNVYLPLKAGRRSVVVAIVDQGTMSLLRFGEAEFARWRIAGHR